jgi:hypothetical protein
VMSWRMAEMFKPHLERGGRPRRDDHRVMVPLHARLANSTRVNGREALPPGSQHIYIL